MKILWWSSATFFFIGVMGAGVWVSNLTSFPFARVKAEHISSELILLGRKGKQLDERRLNHQVRRLGRVELSEVSPEFLKILVEQEDKHFYSHSGIDLKAILRAAMSPKREGASTITMQVVSLLQQKNHAQKSFWDKLHEMGMAIKLEATWTKEQILETYINQLSFRGELQGLLAATRGLFQKDPLYLTLKESLLLAALVPGPNHSHERIADRACAFAVRKGFGVNCQDLRVLSSKTFEKKAILPEAEHLALPLLMTFKTSSKGLIKTTLDESLQRFVLQVSRDQVTQLQKQNVSESAVLVIHNKTNEVLAYTSFSTQERSYVDGVKALRQLGSTLKPFIYAQAIHERLLTSGTLLEDSNLEVKLPQGIYRPENYDHLFHGTLPLSLALGNSLNVPAVRALSLVGVDMFLETLSKMNFPLKKEENYYGPSLALGAVDASLWNLAEAYLMLAHEGKWSELKLEIKDGVSEEKMIFSAPTARIVSHILAQNENRQMTFGSQNILNTPYWSAVKTGTSKDMRDNWCVGYTSEYTVATWVGNFSGAPMWNVSGVQGAAPIWRKVMDHLHQQLPSRPVELGEDLVGAFDKSSQKEDWYLKGTLPTQVSQWARKSPRILYPLDKMLVARDPGMPKGAEKILFQSHGSEKEELKKLIWELDGRKLGEGEELPWGPAVGVHDLSLLNLQGEKLDHVQFTVR